MRILEFCNSLGLGGTEKAACRWAQGLRARGHDVHFLSLKPGLRVSELKEASIPVSIASSTSAILKVLQRFRPDVIHAHAPGTPHEGDILGEALCGVPKIPVVQTNIFGRFENPAEDRWVDFRLFISWTSCVQAARRSNKSLNAEFFERCSVAVYPLDADDGPTGEERSAMRQKLGISEDEIVLGRLSRPEPNKWTDLPLKAFRLAAQSNPKIRLLLREAPPLVSAKLHHAADSARYILLPATYDRDELRQTLGALDIVLHTSLIGESFGYGIAEPMNLGKPVIANSVPWFDQAQIELIRPGEGGLIASTPRTMARAIHMLAENSEFRQRLGRQAQKHIREIANPERSLNRLESALSLAVSGNYGAYALDDLPNAIRAAKYLDAHQFGTGFREQLILRGFHTYLRAAIFAARCKNRLKIAHSL